MWAIYKKELKSYFLSPIGYIAIGLFLLAFGILFFLTTVLMRTNDMWYCYSYGVYILLLIAPIITMRMFAEERKSGTEQLLLTSPKSITAIVLGKFLAAVTLIVIILIFSLLYYIILCFFKAPDLTVVFVSMLGFLLAGAAAIALGMFISSITENQVIAAVMSISIIVITGYLPNFGNGFSIIDILGNYQSFPLGVISISETISLLSFAVSCILFTIIIMKKRKAIK